MKLPSSLDPEQEKKRQSATIDDMLGRMHQGFSTYGETDLDEEIAFGEGTTAIAEDSQVGEESPTSRAVYHPQDINDAEAIASSDNLTIILDLPPLLQLLLVISTAKKH